MGKSCDNCKHKKIKRTVPVICFDCHCHWIDKWEHKPISFHRLNGLNPTFTSCRDKLFEEIGEYLQLTGKGMKASGETHDTFSSPRRLIEELADVAQSAVTQMHVIADEAGLDLDDIMAGHNAKLREKGYLVEK